ncbi:hypothetical protein N9L49_05560, partial [Rhodospirillales bacterium]|nr:hypothetical protein [Rhodospirillales bacterium]
LTSDVSSVLDYEVVEWKEINSTTINIVFETLECEDPDNESDTYKNRFICLLTFDPEVGWHIDTDHIIT